jgi:hypothetical protein
MLSFNPKEISQSLRMLCLLEHLMLPFALMYVSSQSTIKKTPIFQSAVHAYIFQGTHSGSWILD